MAFESDINRECKSEEIFSERLIEVPQGFNINAFFQKMMVAGDVNNAYSRAASYHGDRDRAIELINSRANLKAPLYLETEDFYDNEKVIAAAKEKISEFKKLKKQKNEVILAEPESTDEGEHE